jgi:hypothetical protein
MSSWRAGSRLEFAGLKLPLSKTHAVGLLGWCSLALLALLALGGAAADSRGLWIGLPGLSLAAPAVLLVAVLAILHGAAPGAPLLGLTVFGVVLLAGRSVPGAGAFSGPPLLAVALAGVALVIAARPPALPRGLFLPLVLALHCGAAARDQLQVGPQGDEPHYLMVADSLWRDRDVALSRDYAEGRYRAFHDRPLEPHYRVRGREGEIYSVHAVGLSLLVLPAYALGGYPAVSFFMALLAALLAREVRELVRDVTADDRAAEGAGWLMALCPPLIHFAGLVFTEVPAALAIALVLRHGRRASGVGAALAWGAALAFLPWLHVRYSAFAVVLGLYVLSHRPPPRVLAALLAVGAVSALALLAYHQALYGTPDPRVVWGRRPEFALAALPLGLQGLLLDQEFGLLVYAPVFALALPGLWLLLRASPRVGAASAALLLGALVLAGSWHMWRGGWNPPARFLVPALPALGLAVAVTLRRGLGAAAALLVGWSLWTGLAGAWEPRGIHRDRDGTAPFFRAFSGAEEWTRLLPGFVLEEIPSAADRGRLAVVWALALAGAVAATLRARTRPGPGRVAAAAVAALASSGLASWLSRSRTSGRDAVRLVGRPALALPAWRLERAHEARWGPEVLDWGPVYEPHRHPSGVEVGARLPLRPGAFTVELRWDELGEGAPAGRLEVRGEGGATASVLLEPRPGGAAGPFDVPGGERAVTLALRASGPLLLKEIRVRSNPPAAARSNRHEGDVDAPGGE